jgi:hypothetical protein
MAKLTSQMLKKLVEEEMARFGKMEDVEDAQNDTEEVDADELGDDKVLAKKIDMAKAFGVEEARLVKRLKEVRVKRARLIAEIKNAAEKI